MSGPKPPEPKPQQAADGPEWFARSRVLPAVAALLVGLGVIALPFLMHVGGPAAGIAATIGFLAVLGAYVVLWKAAVARLAARLRSTTFSQSRQELVVVCAYWAISLTTLAVALGVIWIARR